MDYGFVLEGNEWEYYPLALRMREHCREGRTPGGCDARKAKAELRRRGMSASYTLRLRWDTWGEGMAFFTVLHMKPGEVEGAGGGEGTRRKEAVESYMYLIEKCLGSVGVEVGGKGERAEAAREYVKRRREVLEEARGRCVEALEEIEEIGGRSDDD